jgi:hypothetical protein
MNRWRVGGDRGSKETDGCPLTEIETNYHSTHSIKKLTQISILETTSLLQLLNPNQPHT